MKDTLVSIITPCYNASAFIAQTIESVLAQTYKNWEMLIVDDCSTDNSSEIVKIYQQKDTRIKYLKTDKASGSPVHPRNIAIKAAQGRYIAFLDSDDLWLPNKLQEQIDLFSTACEDVALVYSNYKKIDEQGKLHLRMITAPQRVSYADLLKGNVIACLTAVYDTKKVGKIYLKAIKHEDYVLWLSILKKGFRAENTNTLTALYRIVKGSVSSNKLKTLMWQWNIYIHEEQTGYVKGAYYFINYSIRALLKSIK